MLKVINVILLFLLLSSCNPTPQCYVGGFLNITDYTFRTNRISTQGISVDDRNFELNLDHLDNKVSELESCLSLSIDRSCFKVLVPTDTYISSCSGQTLFPCAVPPQLCEDKDLVVTEECPCNCQGAIQDDYIIVTVPSMITFKLELTRLISNVNNPYKDPNMKGCL
jgi:hypothetical protein